MKAFISQPMKNKTHGQILEERKATESLIKELYPGAEILQSYNPDFKGKNAIASLGEIIKTYLSQADHVFMCKGWEDSRGCFVEHTCAKEYGIPISYYPYAKEDRDGRD